MEGGSSTDGGRIRKDLKKNGRRPIKIDFRNLRRGNEDNLSQYSQWPGRNSKAALQKTVLDATL
jgi:hypothetical protein